MGFVEDGERFAAGTTGEWRAWLERHHDRGEGVWLVSWKAATGQPRMEYEEQVETALCFGWVDSRQQTVDAERTMMWFAPRKSGSGWVRTNKERIERLTAAGLMDASGLAVVERAKADGSWTLFDSVERLEVPGDLDAALAAAPPARANWDAFPPSVRKQMLMQLVLAKTAATRAARVAKVAEHAARGERAWG